MSRAETRPRSRTVSTLAGKQTSPPPPTRQTINLPTYTASVLPTTKNHTQHTATKPLFFSCTPGKRCNTKKVQQQRPVSFPPQAQNVANEAAQALSQVEVDVAPLEARGRDRETGRVRENEPSAYRKNAAGYSQVLYPSPARGNAPRVADAQRRRGQKVQHA